MRTAREIAGGIANLWNPDISYELFVELIQGNIRAYGEELREEACREMCPLCETGTEFIIHENGEVTHQDIDRFYGMCKASAIRSLPLH